MILSIGSEPFGRGLKNLPSLSVAARAKAWTDAIIAALRPQSRSAASSAIIQSAQDAIISKDLDGKIRTWNSGAEKIFGYASREALGKYITMLLPPDRLEEETEILRRVRKGEVVEPYDTFRLHKNGHLIPISVAVSPIQGADGRIIGASKIARDITRLKQRQETQELLLREMNHRIKNTLSIVQVVAKQSFAQATAAERERFGARLRAIARANDALTRHAVPSASILDILSHSLDPFQRVQGDRLVGKGPEISLGADHALVLTLVFYELATNAIKYGALSNETGKVEVTWEVSQVANQPAVVLKWQETGGPPVMAPQQKGFGSALLERTFGDAKSLEYSPTGLTAIFNIKL